jgi:DNA-binding NarL/FixJ family response regulator
VTVTGPGKRILLVDDHPIVRDGLAQLINQSGDLTVCGEAGDPAEALQAIDGARPDLAILDLSLKGGDGLELIKQIRARWPKLPILVLSMHSEDLFAERVLRAGARGYIMKQEATRSVLGAIRKVLAGDVYLSSEIQSHLLRRCVGSAGEQARLPIDTLSDRELTVLELIGRGLSTRAIARELKLSVKTVESYRDHIKKKLNLSSSTQLIHYAVRWMLNVHNRAPA